MALWFRVDDYRIGARMLFSGFEVLSLKVWGYSYRSESRSAGFRWFRVSGL